jgi:hypothetical protein
MGIFGLLARHGDEVGSLTPLHDDDLETEAQWKGKKGHFARVFREHYQLASGELRNWQKWNGAQIAKAKKDRERKRESRRSGARQSTPASTDSPRTGHGAARVPDLTRPDQLLTTPESPVGDRGGWVAAAVRRWAAHVGVVTHGRMGKVLRPAVALYGEAAVLAAIEKFGEWRARREPGKQGELPGLPQFVANIRAHIPPTMLPPELGEAS